MAPSTGPQVVHDGKRLYKKRAATIEPVFAQIEHNRGIHTRRGLAAADSGSKLICATHNLLKLVRPPYLRGGAARVERRAASAGGVM